MILTSLSARRAWIEIWCKNFIHCFAIVALRKESVDRNAENPMIRVDKITVALRKESVDRNPEGGAMGITIKVALRKESVDRNKRLTHFWKVP